MPLLPVFIFFEYCYTHRDFRDCQVNIECVPGFRASENGWFSEILLDCCKCLVALFIPTSLLGFFQDGKERLQKICEAGYEQP